MDDTSCSTGPTWRAGGPNRVRGAPKKNTYPDLTPVLSIIEGINLETSNQVALHTTTGWLRDAHGWPTWVVNRQHLIIGHIMLDTSFAAATSGRTCIPALMDQLYLRPLNFKSSLRSCLTLRQNSNPNYKRLRAQLSSGPVLFLVYHNRTRIFLELLIRLFIICQHRLPPPAPSPPPPLPLPLPLCAAQKGLRRHPATYIQSRACRSSLNLTAPRKAQISIGAAYVASSSAEARGATPKGREETLEDIFSHIGRMPTCIAPGPAALYLTPPAKVWPNT
ncbi:hypothetical protein B0H14DRAFT_3031359 [Mycena olivaceomarginata]|nr:hypothetical protein B0H14DRAFT_3031359 [Mycena olivaceomarginata]